MRAMGRVMLGGAATSGCGFVLATVYDDEFDCGASIDTAGTRFSGANAWSLYHSPGTTSQSGGLLTLGIAGYGGGGFPQGVLQSLPGGSGDWRFRAKFTPTTINPSFPLIGMILRESATDKVLAGGQSNVFFETRRINAGFWGATYSGGAVGGGVGTVTYVEISRISSNIEFRLTANAADGEDLTTPLTTGASTGSHAQTADFTTAPDQWGICVVDDVADFDWVRRLL